jgi:hypothetical protein
MFNTLRAAAAFRAAIVAAMFAVAMPAFSQSPTDAQRKAIRSQCRSDYIAHCASIPPGGAASLQCLQSNMSNLSSSCQSAVRAVESPAAPEAESAPAAGATKPTDQPAAAPAPKPAASTAAKKPSSAQVAAIRSSCRSDYQDVCAGVPPGGAAALKCLVNNSSKLSPGCRQAVTAASGSAAPPATGDTPAAETNAPEAAPLAAPAPVLVLRPMRPREVLFVLRSACGEDARTLCAGIPPGGGRILQCLTAQAASLSPPCQQVLSQFAVQ